MSGLKMIFLHVLWFLSAGADSSAYYIFFPLVTQFNEQYFGAILTYDDSRIPISIFLVTSNSVVDLSINPPRNFKNALKTAPEIWQPWNCKEKTILLVFFVGNFLLLASLSPFQLASTVTEKTSLPFKYTFTITMITLWIPGALYNIVFFLPYFKHLIEINIPDQPAAGAGATKTPGGEAKTMKMNRRLNLEKLKTQKE
mgnify:CR=1 FL=1